MEFTEFRFVFHARDFERSVRFYMQSLGMPRVGGWDRQDGKGALLSAGGSAVVEIFGAVEGQAYNGPAPTAMSLSLRLAEAGLVDQAYEQLRSAGIRVGNPPVNHAWGHRAFVVYDPDDIPIHIYAVIAPG